jgi:trans-aconitate 2-methyltransferase
MQAQWNPELYRRFEDERTRPAQDLLARVPLSEPPLVVDVGCGPGNSTELLLERFPNATTLGIDNSEAMLESARARLPACRFEPGDVSQWQPDSPPDLIFANAVLQWVPHHDWLFPRLFGLLAPGGVLAVQMPDNMDEPTHRLMRDVAASPEWASALGDAAKARARILAADEYYDLLVAQGAQVELWRTTYQHPMQSPGAIVDWLRATGLRPFLEPLSEQQQAAFLSEYERRVAKAYRPLADGQRLLAFPRLFIVARRAR